MQITWKWPPRLKGKTRFQNIKIMKITYMPVYAFLFIDLKFPLKGKIIDHLLNH